MYTLNPTEPLGHCIRCVLPALSSCCGYWCDQALHASHSLTLTLCPCLPAYSCCPPLTPSLSHTHSLPSPCLPGAAHLGLPQHQGHPRLPPTGYREGAQVRCRQLPQKPGLGSRRQLPGTLDPDPQPPLQLNPKPRSLNPPCNHVTVSQNTASQLALTPQTLPHPVSRTHSPDRSYLVIRFFP